MPTPLYDALRDAAGRCPLRFDMPGHHGQPLPYPLELSHDVTEHAATGDLFGAGGDAIERAEQLWAGRLGFDSCLFLTGGSTQGVHTGLSLLAGDRGHVALDRGSHRAAYNALALLDGVPHYLSRPWLAAEGVWGAVRPDQVADTLSRHPDIKTVCITSPTYYGVLSDIPALAAVCHTHGARLMVDAAHGAHLPWLDYTGYQAADLVVMSAHKTLPSPGQSALLLANGIPMEELRRAGSVYGSSSPSYLLMAGMDGVRDYMEGDGQREYRRVASAAARMRKTLPALDLDNGDPTRLVIRCGDGFALAEGLERRGIWPEMADRGHVVFLLTCADSDNALSRLEGVLTGLLTGREIPKSFGDLTPPPLPEQVLSLRRAMFAPRVYLPLERCGGRVSAMQIAPYPPGVPVAAPGERLEKKHLEYLEKIGYHNNRVAVVQMEDDC